MKSSKNKLSGIIGKWRKSRKGYFVVYAKEGKRFVVPLYYLNHPIFKVLLEMAEEEFGSTVDGPLQVPCEEELMDFILALLRNNWHLDVEKAFVSLNSTTASACKGAPMSSA
ncbi:hypothetical protein MKX01_006162 [Papaver californicum]|nr:hypothetical protein MKX01_006162 [Papaver californicum]